MNIQLKYKTFHPSISGLIENDLRESRANGLVTIEFPEGIFVFLVTKQSIYEFDSVNKDCREFLAKQIRSEHFTICTTDGYFDSSRLRKHMHINLRDLNNKILDLPTLYAQLEIRENMVRRVSSRHETFTSEYISKNVKLKRLSFGELVKKYLPNFTRLELTNPHRSKNVLDRIETLPPLEKQTVISNLALVCFARKLAIELLTRVQRQKSQVCKSMIAMSRANAELRQKYETDKENNKYDTLAHYVANLKQKKSDS